jgi:hypothetical protein
VNTNDPNLPNYVRPEAQKVRWDLELIADLLAGTRRMWDQSAAKKYIRRWEAETQKIYEIRRQCETLFEGFARVLSAAVGMLFAKPPVVEWNQSEAAMTEHWANLDGLGTAGPVLCKRYSEQTLRDGLGLILVDHPPAPDGETVTAEREAALNLRPHWALYGRLQILSWRLDKIDNQTTTVQIVLEECTAKNTGTYGVEERKRYRVLRLVPAPAELGAEAGGWRAEWELFEETKDGRATNGFASVGQGEFRNRQGEVADRLPIGAGYTGRTEAPFCASLPLLGVAYANLAHWQLSTNLRFYRDLAAFPQPVIIGDLANETVMAAGGEASTVPGKFRVGPAVAVHLKGEGSSFEWKAPPTEAFAALENGIKEKLQQMGELGMSFLTPDTRAAETAEAKRLDATAENSTLATAAQGIEDALNAALEWHAWYLGIEKAGAPVITINKDFEATVMEPAVMQAYAQLARDMGLPVMVVLRALQQGGRIPQDANLEELEREMIANHLAEEERRRQEAEDQARLAGQGTNGVPAGIGA